ncbi:MAG: hypothetical protein U0903_20770 [Planctomycetales bacterium]
MNYFRQLSDDQMGLLLCGMALLGCWCILQISFYLGRANEQRKTLSLRTASEQDRRMKSHEKAA